MRAVAALASLAIAFIMCFPALAMPAAADGHSSIHYPGDSSWSSLNERSQYALISYQNGMENMIMAIEIYRNALASGSQIFWIFPIPADPSASHIGVLPKLTKLDGGSLSDHLNSTIKNDFAAIYATQIYAIPFSIAMTLPSESNYDGGFGHLGGGFGGIGSGNVTVFEHVEGGGLATELLSTQDDSSLSAYLGEKGLSLSGDISALMSDYIGKDYCFVVSWVADAALLSSLHPVDYSMPWDYNSFSVGVSVSFPTDDIFFPLKLTKAYGEASIPIKVDVLGFVSPKNLGVFPDSMDVKVTYRIDTDLKFNESMSYFFTSAFGDDANDGNLKDVEYTELRITSPALAFNDDLLLEESAPASISTYRFIEGYHWVIIILLFAGTSSLAGLLSGMLTFRHRHPSKRKFAALGLFNTLTLITLIIATYRSKAGSMMATPPEGDDAGDRKAMFVIHFIWMFIIFSIVAQVIFTYLVPALYVA